jgi:signal transduction histidine kinase
MKRAPSLLIGIAGGTIVVSLLAAAAAVGIFYLQFRLTDDRMRARTLMVPARLIEHALKETPDEDDPLPPDLAAKLVKSGIQYTVVGEKNAMIAASPGLSAPLYKTSHKDARDYFILRGRQPTLYGVTRRIDAAVPGEFIWIEVASTDREMQMHSFISDFVDHLGLLWAASVLILLAVNIYIIHRVLRPLRHASACAAAIGPDSVSTRLPETGMPREVEPLVRAVNLALSRLEAGYSAQRAFIADAAHELRTPLAVLEAHLDAMSERGAPLRPDLAAMKRLVNQLLDVARLDAVDAVPQDVTDLRALAVDVGTHMAPLAVQQKRSLEVVGCEDPVLVRGVYDFLFRALRNLVENALAHTPPDTLVTIAVAEGAISVIDQGPGIPPTERELVCQRFWRGPRNRAGTVGSGAGLGMAIVARTVEAHLGTLEIGDAPGGGAVVTIRLRPVSAVA